MLERKREEGGREKGLKRLIKRGIIEEGERRKEEKMKEGPELEDM